VESKAQEIPTFGPHEQCLHESHDDGRCRRVSVFDLWFFCAKVKTCKPFNWFFQRGGVFCIQTCEQWRENTSLKAEDKLRKGNLVRVAFRKPLSKVKLHAIMAATYPKIKVLGPVTIDAFSTESTVSSLQQQYGQYAPFFSTPFPPTPCQIGKFQCCKWMRGGNPRCLDCEVSGFQWRDTAFPPMPDPEDLLHEAAERTPLDAWSPCRKSWRGTRRKYTTVKYTLKKHTSTVFFLLFLLFFLLFCFFLFLLLFSTVPLLSLL
jgi:hypothetical protein